MKNKLAKYSPLLIILVTLTVVWLLASYVFKVQELFLPRPTKVFQALYELLGTQQFWKDVGGSFYRVFMAFTFSLLIALPIVLLSLLHNGFKRAVFYVVEFFRYLPVPVFIPLAILWFGVDDGSKIFVIFLGTFAQMIPMYFDSGSVLMKSYSSSQYALKWNKWKVVRHIVIPGSAPAIWDNSRICFGWAWTYLIIAELLGAKNGLGYAIIRAQRYLATDRIFAYVIVIGLIGLFSDRLIDFSKRQLFKWNVL